MRGTPAFPTAIITAFLAGALCALSFRRHRTRRELSAAGPVWRCTDCGKAMESETGDPEYVRHFREVRE